MTNQTRKRLWPVSLLVMALAIVGAAAAFVMASSPTLTEAHDPDPPVYGDAHCNEFGTGFLGEIRRGIHDDQAGDDHSCDDPPMMGTGTPAPTGTGTPAPTTMPPADHASMPMSYSLQGLDNGARLDWEPPRDVSAGAEVVYYTIHRDAWHASASHPINMHGDTEIMAAAMPTHYSDLGLAYSTTYSYKVAALVRYRSGSAGYAAAVAEWWNGLNCMQMNDAVAGHVGNGPAVGADMDGSTYCHMYADLSDGATEVVNRTYNAAGYNKGDYTATRSTTTSAAGGRLAALLDPPTMVRDLRAGHSCADAVNLRWAAPTDFGDVPEQDDNGVYVGPDYIGGQVAGLEEVGQEATSLTYEIQRSVNNGRWNLVTDDVDMTSYDDTNVSYGSTYIYRVRARNAANLYSGWEMVTIELTRPDAPLRPSSLVVNLEEGQQSFELQWDPPGDPSLLWRTQDDFDEAEDDGDYQSHNLAYIIERQIGDAPWVEIRKQPHQYSRDGLRTVLTQEYIHEPDDLSDIRGQEVRYRVSALVNDCNPSDWNQADELEVPEPTEPGRPTGLTAAAMGQNRIDLSWTAPDDGGSPITGYTLEYSTDNGSTWSIPAAIGGRTTYSHTGLTAGTAYTYRVTAVNAIGSGMASVTAMATTTAAPPQPLGARPVITAVSSNAAGSATITLVPAANATKHYVWAYPVGGPQGQWSPMAAGSARSVTITGLTSGKSYWFIAIAGNATEWSGWSGWTSPHAIR